jgi:8-amino-7-oxononanoate synthase
LLCSPTIRSFLINFARPLIFSTALPHSTLLSLESVWDVLESQEGDDRRQSLYALADHLHSLLVPILKSTSPKVLRLPPTSPDPFPQGNPYLRSDPASPILGLITPEPHALAQFFLDRGFIVRPVVPPTVPPGEERVRICLRAGMDKAVVERLAAILQDWARLKGKRQVVQGPSQGVVSLRAKL